MTDILHTNVDEWHTHNDRKKFVCFKPVVVVVAAVVVVVVVVFFFHYLKSLPCSFKTHHCRNALSLVYRECCLLAISKL